MKCHEKLQGPQVLIPCKLESPQKSLQQKSARAITLTEEKCRDGRELMKTLESKLVPKVMLGPLEVEPADWKKLVEHSKIFCNFDLQATPTAWYDVLFVLLKPPDEEKQSFHPVHWDEAQP